MLDACDEAAELPQVWRAIPSKQKFSKQSTVGKGANGVHPTCNQYIYIYIQIHALYTPVTINTNKLAFIN